MPHALFLGSHLATVDRLDIAPRPPIELSKPIMRRIPGQDLLSMLPERWRPLGRTEKLRRELGYSSQSAAGQTAAPGPTTLEGPDRKRMEVDEEIEHMIMKDQARYQAEMNAFDRVKFASIHIGHATVSAFYVLTGVMADTARPTCRSIPCCHSSDSP
jgi:metal iron transporter